jgi:hypothetical protein
MVHGAGLARTLAAVGAAVLAIAVAVVPVSASASARTVVPPPSAGVFDYQIGGAYTPAADVQIVDRDRSSVPAPGRYNICYINAFQTQPGESAFWLKHHRGLLLSVHGRLVHDPDWPGEYMLDTSTASTRAQIAAIVGAWIDGCARKGFDAVEPDNLDSWTRKGVAGAITRDDDLAEARLLVARAHTDGLAIAQKNAAEIARTGRASIGFDFAIAEECGYYDECSDYTAAYGPHVLEVEYTDNPRSAYTKACAARHGSISIILRDRDVVARGRRGYVYEHC